MVLIELENYSSASSALPLKVCVLLRTTPLLVAGISLAKYSTTFFSTWTPLLFSLLSTRTHRWQLREFMTHLWALSLLDPFATTPFSSVGQSTCSHVTRLVPANLKVAYNDACNIVTYFPTVEEMAKFENPAIDLGATHPRPVSSCDKIQSAYVPSTAGSRASGDYNCNGGGANSAPSQHNSAEKTAASFLALHHMWRARARGFCEYVLTDDRLWQGNREPHATSSSASNALSRTISVCARIDLILEVFTSLLERSRPLSVEEHDLLFYLKRHAMCISVVLCGRVLRYLLGDSVRDIICEETSGPQHEGELMERHVLNLCLCCTVVSAGVADGNTREANVSALETAKWKDALLSFILSLSTPDQATVDLTQYHSKVEHFSLHHRDCSHLRMPVSALVAEEVERHQNLLQPGATAPLALRRHRSDTLLKYICKAEELLSST